MPSSSSAFYLPATLAVAQRFLAHGDVPELPIERAALFTALMALTRPALAPADVVRTIVDAETLFASPDREGAAEALRELRDGLPADLHTGGIDRLADQGLFFATETVMREQRWCGADGRYADDFQERCRDTLIDRDIRLGDAAVDDDDQYSDDDPDRETRLRGRAMFHFRGTRDQIVAATAIASAPFEPVGIVATAGSGKTHLMLMLAEHIRGNCTHLAPSEAHRYAFQHRVGPGRVISRTLAGVAHEAAANHVQKNRDTRVVRPPQMGESYLSLAEQAKRCGIPAIGNAAPAVVLASILSAIRLWCYGKDTALALHHFADRWRMPPMDQAAYVAWAQRVWSRMFEPLNPRDERVFSLALFHLAKWLDLEGADLPTMGTLLIDEAHDLSAPWYALLQRYPGGWLTLGDPYQRIVGRASHASVAKTFTMTQSVRTGARVEPMIRRTLALHSATLIDGTFSGSRDHATRHHAYEHTTELPHTGLRVYGSAWALLEDALRMRAKGAWFRLLPASEKIMIRMAKDAIMLRRYGDRPTQYHLRRFTAWEQFADDLVRTGYASLLAAFERGFSVDDLDALQRAQAAEGEQDLTLGLLEHCKNLEFSQVGMAPCCFASPNGRPNDELVKGVYVAMTRVRDELWLPGDALDRMADQLRTSQGSDDAPAFAGVA